MARTDRFDLGGLRLSSGEGRRLDLEVAQEPYDLAGTRYEARPELLPVRLDVSRTTGGGYALLLLQLLDGGDEVSIAGGALELLRFGGFGHAVAQRFDEVGLTAFEEELHVAHGFAVNLGGGQVFHARTEAALDVVLQAGTRMSAG